MAVPIGKDDNRTSGAGRSPIDTKQKIPNAGGSQAKPGNTVKEKPDPVTENKKNIDNLLSEKLLKKSYNFLIAPCSPKKTHDAFVSDPCV